MDRWLASLQKVAHETPASAKPGPRVEPIFADLCKVDSDGGDVAGVITATVYDGDPDNTSIPDPVAAFFQKANDNKFRIPEITPPHEDGTFIEKGSDGAVWEYSYEGGTLQKIVLQDRKLGRMEFDGRGNEIGKNIRASWPGSIRPIELLPTVQGGIPVRFDLDLLTDSWDELLGSSAYPEKRPEVPADSKTKVTSSEAYNVGGQILAKGEISSRMYKVLEQIRSFCEGQEAVLLEKSIKALDLAAFGELAEPVLARMRRATELVRSY